MVRTSLLILLLALAGHAIADINVTFDSFTGISQDVPLAVYVNASDNGSYTGFISAPDDLIQAMTYDVNEDGTLELTVKADTMINLDAGIRYAIIRIPPSVLTSLDLSGSGILSVDGSLIDSTSQLSVSVTGSGQLAVENANATSLDSENSGSGSQTVTGSLGDVGISASGSGAVYVSDTVDEYLSSVMLDITGSSQIYIDSAGAPSITGSVSGSGSVSYTQGSCDLTGSSGVSSADCMQVSAVTLPDSISLPDSTPSSAAAAPSSSFDSTTVSSS